MPLWVMTGVGIRSSWCRATRIWSFRRRGQSPGLRVRYLVPCRRTDRGVRSQVRVPHDLQQEPARPGDRRRLLHACAVRPRQRHVRHVHGLRHARHEQERGIAPRNCPSPTTTWTSLRQPRGYCDVADLSRRAGPAGALYVRREPLRHRPARRRDATRPARHAVAGARAAGRRGVQRGHRMLRAGEHVLVFPDGHDHDGHAVVGFGGERVTGTAGHVDRQWSPLVANDGGPTGDIRSRGHDGARSTWTTAWTSAYGGSSTGRITMRHTVFGRPQLSRLRPGVRRRRRGHLTSYVRWPESIRTLVPPPAAARYLSDRHRLTSHKFDLDLAGEPLVAAPAHCCRSSIWRVRTDTTGPCVVNRSAASRSTNDRWRCIATGN